MKYFVIFSKEDKELLNNFIDNNAHLATEITAISITQTSPTLRDTLLNKNIISKDNIYDLSQLALTKTHIDLWQEAIEEKTDITVFDIHTVTHPNFLKLQQKALNSLNQYDLVTWGYNLNWDICVQSVPGTPKFMITFPGDSETEMRTPSNDLIDVHTYQNTPIQPQLLHAFSFAGASCYTLSYKGAKKLLKQILPITGQAVPAPQKILYGSNLYAIVPIDKRENISLDIEINRHLEELDSYISFPMMAVLPTINKTLPNA